MLTPTKAPPRKCTKEHVSIGEKGLVSDETTTGETKRGLVSLWFEILENEVRPTL